ncbi:hypothetical protein HYH02_000303 [Chlamydomonas schloesseri]|uniref:Uncharacterized protein n=1 Tax=Chlamydomonas schloesseri TaxID=2026947 RepID=A0A836B7Q7_9CHLO|nr:hypothetical protein HYH02_000303 [Chlamydomonas schloesseri]|eukprot:KAG2450201.1 hypothetical protein HYH02_000303 [Chlamydomonas schloesseri]
MSLPVITTGDRVGVCRQVAQLALDCLGPGGRLKALQAAPDTPASVLTSTSGPLFQGIRADSAFKQLLFSGTAVAQHAEFGDGGLMSITLASRLIQAVLERCRSRRELYEASATLELIGNRLLDALSHGAEGLARIPCTSLSQYLALTRGVLVPKLSRVLDAEELEHLVLTVTEAFVSSLPSSAPAEGPAAGGSAAAGSRVMVHCLRGAAVADSRVLQGVLLQAADLPEEALDLLGMAAGGEAEEEAAAESVEVGVLLLACSLDTHRNQYNSADVGGGAGAAPARGVALVEEQREELAPGEAEAAELDGLVASLEPLLEPGRNIRLVACQKGIHPAAQEWLLARGVVPCQRLGAARLAALATLAGCAPLETLLGAPSARNLADIGYSRLQMQSVVISGQQLVYMLPAGSTVQAAGPITTLLLGCTSDAVADHLRPNAEAALKLLKATMLQDPVAIKGAGMAEQRAP